MLIITAAKTDLKCSLFIKKILDGAEEHRLRPTISKILDLTNFGQSRDQFKVILLVISHVIGWSRDYVIGLVM